MAGIKAYERPLKVTDDGKLELPADLVAELPPGEFLRVIILVPESSGSNRDDAQRRLTAEQFAAGYAESDAIYDAI